MPETLRLRLPGGLILEVWAGLLSKTDLGRVAPAPALAFDAVGPDHKITAATPVERLRSEPPLAAARQP